MKELIRKIVSRITPTASLEKNSIAGVALNLVKGTFNEDYDNAWLYELSKGSQQFVDIGANMGFHSVLGLVSGHVQKALLADANPDALTVAASNLLHNNVVHLASFYAGFVSDTDNEQVKFWSVGVGAAGSMYESHAKTAHKQGASYFVNTVTLDSLVKHFSIQPDLIKVDVEGAEINVLRGSDETTRRFKPRYFVEMHSNAELTMEQNASQVLQWCSKYGYKAYYLKEHTELTDPATIKHRGRCHLLLQESNASYPQSLRGIAQGQLLKQPKS